MPPRPGDWPENRRRNRPFRQRGLTRDHRGLPTSLRADRIHSSHLVSHGNQLVACRRSQFPASCIVLPLEMLTAEAEKHQFSFSHLNAVTALDLRRRKKSFTAHIGWIGPFAKGEREFPGARFVKQPGMTEPGYL